MQAMTRQDHLRPSLISTFPAMEHTDARPVRTALRAGFVGGADRPRGLVRVEACCWGVAPGACAGVRALRESIHVHVRTRVCVHTCALMRARVLAQVCLRVCVSACVPGLVHMCASVCACTRACWGEQCMQRQCKVHVGFRTN